jgi:hypothetical protein
VEFTPVVTRTHLLAATLGVVAMACGTPTLSTSAPEGPSVAAADPIALQRSLSEADSVFVGRLVSVDRGWHSCSGAISISEAELRFRVVRFLKGASTKEEVAISHPVLWNSVYFEDGRAAGKGLRFASTFFHKGSEYVALVQKMRLSPGDRERYWPAGDLGFSIWVATPENISALEGALARSTHLGTAP